MNFNDIPGNLSIPAGYTLRTNATNDGFEVVDTSIFNDGDKGDIVVSSSGTVWTIDSGAVSDSKIASGITASKITQTSSYRFVTDAEKSTWNGKQDLLVSATNIKTINGTSLLGSGDITVSGAVTDGDKGDITVSGTGTVWTVDNDAVLAKVLTGYTSGAGTVSATDNILQAFQKLNGNINALVTGVSSVNGLTGSVALTGTTDRITVSIANAFDIASTYIGQTSITTLGTIITGTWNSSIISPTYGGTGVNNASRTLTINTNSGTLDFTSSSKTLTISDNASVSGTNTGDQTLNSLLPTQTGNNGKYLTTDGTNSSWATVAGGVSDGDKGDITVSGTGTVWTIDSGAVDDGKIASGITASKITQTSSYRFVTDAEKSTWNGKVDSNGAITGATKTKITYDAKGLITSATDATTADINDSTDKRYVTDAQLTVISNTSGTNTGDQTLNSLLPSQTGNSGKILKTDGSNSSWSDNYGTFGITIDGAGNVITTGFKQFLVVPYNCIITEWHIISNASGSCVIDVWKDTTIPTVIDSITGTEKPTLSSQQTNNDTTLSTWTTTVNANDIIGFNVDSISGLTKITLVIKVRKI